MIIKYTAAELRNLADSLNENESIKVIAAKPRRKVTKSWRLNGTDFPDLKGQAKSVLQAIIALDNETEDNTPWTAEQVASKLVDIDPGYPTRCDVTDSTAFHLHQLSLKGALEEIKG